MRRAVLVIALLLSAGAAALHAAGSALFVVGNTTLTASDVVLKNQLLGLGLTVTTVLDTASLASDATGKDLVVISGSVLSTNIGNRFRTVTVPVWLGEEALFDDMDLCSAAGLGNTTGQTQLRIVNSSSYLAAGLGNGLVTVYAPSATLNWGQPNANAIVVAEDPATAANKVIFAYDTGAVMFNSLAAPARRLGMFTEDVAPANLNATGLQLLANSFQWLLGYDSITPTLTASVSPSPSPSATPSATPSNSPSPTFSATVTPSFTPTATPTFSATDTGSFTSTGTPTQSSTATPSFSSTITETFTPTVTATDTATSTQTPTATPSFSATVTGTFSSTGTNTDTETSTQTFTATPTATASSTASHTPSSTATATLSATSSCTSSASPTSTATSTGSATPSSTLTATRSASPSATSSGTLTASSTASLTPSPTRSATSSATLSSTLTASSSPSWTPSASATATPSITVSPSATITGAYTLTPTPAAALVLHASVLDDAGRTVRDLGDAFSYSLGGAIDAGPLPFVPEKAPLSLSVGSAAWAWSGDNGAGEPVPNGAYRVKVTQAGGADLERAFALTHAGASVDRLTLAPNPARRQRVNIAWAPKPGADAVVKIYTLSGDLVAQKSAPGGSGQLDWDLSGPNGQAVSSGIYLVRIELHAGGQRFSELRKLAVLR